MACLNQPKQEQGEPVAKYIGECPSGSLVQLYEDVKKGTDFYTTSQQRTWVGLTDEELRQIWYDDAPVEGGTYVDKLRQVEAKLKEKNT